MYFSELAAYLEKIELESSRLAITVLLAELYHKLSPLELEQTIYLMQGRVSPSYRGEEMGMAEKTIIKSALLALNIEQDYFMREYRKNGDLGKTVENFKKQYISFEEKEITITEVYRELKRIISTTGDGSQEIKKGIISTLLRQIDPLSARYVVRIPQAVLRLGFSDMTVLDAFSWMIAGDKSLRKEIENAYHVRPDLGYIGRILKEKGIKGIQTIQPELFTPIIMMRAERLSSGLEIVEQIGTCAVEPKYDGFRLQAHFSRKANTVKLYSRSLDDVSIMYPDVIEGIQKEIDAEEVILEGEAIGFDPATGGFLPFQETVQRKRKYDIGEKAKEIPLKLFVFELLYKDGINYIHRPFHERRKILVESLKQSKDKEDNIVVLAPHTVIGDGKKIEHMFEDAISRGLEGIVAKKLDGIYQPGARGWNWIKFKRSYSSRIQDTVDCLVMGYDAGKGKRAQFGIGAFLVGVYDAERDMFVTMAKIGTGLTDEEWRTLKLRCDETKIKEKPVLYDVDKNMSVDNWIKPAIVVEIRADEITRSPIHTAGRVMKTSKGGSLGEVEVAGYAFRFPRLERFRTDKKPDDITTLKEITQFYLDSKKER